MSDKAYEVWNTQAKAEEKKRANNPAMAMRIYQEWLDSVTLPFGYEGELDPSLIQRAIDSDE